MQPVDIRSDHLAIVLDILARHVPEAEVWVFGSRAKWLARDTSDLDLCIRAAAPIGFAHMGALREAFEESNLPYKVDVVDWATTAESFRKIIERDKVVVQKGAGMSEWRKVRVDEIAEKIAIGPFGSRMKSDTYTDVGVPVIRGTNLTGGRGFSGEWVYISETDADQLANCNVTEGDLVFPHRGAIGEVGIVPGDRERYLLSSSLMKLKCDPRKAHSLYFFYFFKSHEGRHQLLKNASQVGTPGIGQPLSSLRSIELELPPLDEQRAIAHILGTLDDKIELNRRMNETLEAIARAMFKSWFVDFDPVRAKMSGEPTVSICQRLGLTPDLLALFPDRLVDSELGEIPEGWGVGSLGDVAQHPRRGIQPNQIPPATPYIALEHMPRRCIALSDWGVADNLESNKFEFKKGEILFGKLRPYFHKVGVALVDGVCSTDIVVITPKVDEWLGFVLGHVSSDAFVEHTNAGSTGTKMPRTSWSDMSRYSIALPPKAVAGAFTSFVRPIINRMAASIHEARTLASLRDALLPKLLSGELRVPDAEKTVELMA